VAPGIDTAPGLNARSVNFIHTPRISFTVIEMRPLRGQLLFIRFELNFKFLMETIIDKSKELSASLVLINEKLHFNGQAGHNQPVSIDYTPPLGDNLGYTSLELLLLSVSSCIGSSVLALLRKMRKTITAFNIDSRGIRKQEHPTAFKTIILDLRIVSPDASPDDLQKVIRLSEDTYCPVWAMMKGNVEIVINTFIN
jgi:putative redox protein